MSKLSLYTPKKNLPVLVHSSPTAGTTTNTPACRALQTKPRDNRIDFWRGLALLGICLSHGEWLSDKAIFAYMAFAPLGISTFAHLFVFISGYLFGKVYQHAYITGGYSRLQSKAFLRASRLYLYNLITFLFVYSIHFCSCTFFNIPVREFLHDFNSQDLLKLIFLTQTPDFFGILPLYIVLLLFMPLLLILTNKSVHIAFLLSFSIYATSLLFFKIDAHMLPFPTYAFYPSAWQFLFFIAMCVGLKKFNYRTTFLRHRLCLYISLVFLGLVFIETKLLPFMNTIGILSIPEAYLHIVRLENRQILAPFSLLHFLILVYCFEHILPPTHTFLRSRIARFCRICGRHPLEVFCFGLMVDYSVGVIMRILHGGFWCMLGFDILLVLLSVSFAYSLESLKKIFARGFGIVVADQVELKPKPLLTRHP